MSGLKSFIVLYDGKFIRVYKENDVDKVIEELKDKLRHYPMMVALLESDKKEIAELKAQKAQAEDDCAYWKAKAQRERHHKFKRCLAMTERWLFAFNVTNKCNDKFYLRSLKYRELAEKFNPTSTAMKENSDG